MRGAFVKTLSHLAKKNKNIFLLTGDLGFSIFEGFQEEFPWRFFNVGVAEQNMIGVAAGLALSGKIVFVYSIVPFVTMRCFEQIRNDVCMQNLNVKIIGMGAGLHYGPSGPTHHALEDMSVMRSLPNMTLLSPGSPFETELAIKTAARRKGPYYIRLSKAGKAPEIPTGVKVSLEKGIVVRDGRDMTIIATGAILMRAEEVVNGLGRKGISARLVNIRTIKPIDKDIILNAAEETKVIFTIEEHNITGGLGSAVAEVLGESGHSVFLKRLALPDQFIKDVGSRDYLLAKHNLSVEKITKLVESSLRNLK